MRLAVVTVALIGADGAGKTSVARALERSRELRVKYLYMGINAEASNHMLPTTRALHALKRVLGRGGDEGGPPDPARAARRPRSGMRAWLGRGKSALLLLNRLCEERYRVAVARRYERRGYLVVYDRHFFADYWAHDGAGAKRPLSRMRRAHARWLARLPRPDCTILLDAPASVLFARKAEGTLELLEHRRQEYLDMRAELGNCAVVDASRPPDVVQDEVLGILRGLVPAEARR